MPVAVERRINYIERPSITLPSKRERGFIDYSKVEVAGHELNHALTALGMGIIPHSLSVRPERESLGRTIFLGEIGAHSFQVIAAAGALHTPDGDAHGYGNDIYKVRTIRDLYEGMTEDEAKLKAQAAIDQYSFRARRRTAEIIAFYGEVQGSLIEDILKWSEYEIKLEDMGIEPDSTSFVVEQKPTINTYTQIDYLGRGTMRIIFVKNGKEEKKDLFCEKCGELNGHREDCSSNFDKAVL